MAIALRSLARIPGAPTLTPAARRGRSKGRDVASIVDRRLAPPLPAVARGPGSALSSLTLIGWVSAVVAIGWLVNELRPLLEPGALDARQWEGIAGRVLTALGDAAVIGMPAALELGVPGARRRTPWLMRGLVLLALAQLARPAIAFVQDLATLLDPSFELFDYETPLGLAFGVVTVATGLLSVGGAWALSDGLFDAGARPRRVLMGVVAVTGTAATVVAFVPYLGDALDLAVPLGWLNLASLAISAAVIALWLVVATRLMAGFAPRLAPRRAWFLAAAAGLCLVVSRFGSAAQLLNGGLAPVVSEVLFVVGVTAWVLLFLAFATGLGRGRERRVGRPRRMRLYVLNPTD